MARPGPGPGPGPGGVLPCDAFTALYNYLAGYSPGTGVVGSTTAQYQAEQVYRAFWKDDVDQWAPSGTTINFDTAYPPSSWGYSTVNSSGQFYDPTNNQVATAITGITSNQTDYTIRLSPGAFKQQAQDPWWLVSVQGHELVHVWLNVQGHGLLPDANQDYIANRFQAAFWTKLGVTAQANFYNTAAANLKSQHQSESTWNQTQIDTLVSNLPGIPNTVITNPC